MTEQLIAAFIISVLHGFIPGHWLPFLALAKKMGWSKSTTLRYTGLAAIAHALGTVGVGLSIAQITMIGLRENTNQTNGSGFSITEISIIGHRIPFETFGAVIMILLGIYFLYRHHKHHHFHFPEKANESESRWALGTILLALFLSPCMEIEWYFATLAPMGWTVIWALVLVYSVTTWLSMMGGVWIGFKGLERWNSHRLEHSTGLITGIVMILSGLMLMFG
jgi:putative Mn2+ efflux pump MntP